MSNLTFENPKEFTDEDKYFKFFTLKDLKAMSVGILFTIILACFAKILFLPKTGTLIMVGIGGVVTVAITACSMFVLPVDNYMDGGGCNVLNWMLRRWIRKRNSCYYIKGYSQYEEDYEHAIVIRDDKYLNRVKESKKKRKKVKEKHDKSVKDVNIASNEECSEQNVATYEFEKEVEKDAADDVAVNRVEEQDV